MNAITPRTDTVTAFPVGFAGHGAVASKTLIVVPCYNEAERLNISAFLHYLATSPDVSFIFVNDGSSDATLDRLMELKRCAPDRATILDLSRNSGKAEAVRQGLIAATEMGADLVGYWDADLATPLDAIDDFTRVLNKLGDTQVVYGARRILLGHRIQRTLGRQIVSRLCAMLARQAIRLPVGDTQCGAKLLRNSPALREALARPFSAGWLFDVELFTRLSVRLTDRRTAFFELPLTEWDEVAGSKVSATAIFNSGLRMLRLIAEARFGLDPAACQAMPVSAQQVMLPAAVPARVRA